MSEPPPFVSIVELSRAIGLPVAWLKRGARAGHIPAIRVGRRWMFRTDEVQRALQDRATSSTSNMRDPEVEEGER